jgi:hypothetical protein
MGMRVRESIEVRRQPHRVAVQTGRVPALLIAEEEDVGAVPLSAVLSTRQ